ncbi:hypothetical protein [Agrobacterium tumefaciens]|uniref:hypothetical protein n=1 Tax=Agrobacterium tumefaciens TaxID=358 RepID=UPI001572EEDF|nr:hypothetical protein [Agrobacterium tumefaciens]NTB05885.1 hypothetical protein [Agrobacterium tumefaciens]
MDKELFRLDRHGGPDKIAKATYTPKAYRRENAKPERLSTPKLLMAWVIIFGIIFSVAYLVEKRSSKKPLLPINTMPIWLNK